MEKLSDISGALLLELGELLNLSETIHQLPMRDLKCLDEFRVITPSDEERIEFQLDPLFQIRRFSMVYASNELVLICCNQLIVER